MSSTRALLFLAAIAASFAVPVKAETFHTCGVTISSLPAVITTQGVYCLRSDLATAIANGFAIEVQTNNVTIDCNGYKIGGLAAGDSSFAFGIYASDRRNITVRNCGIRGFQYGIFLAGGGGHLIEDNRLDQNLYTGILIDADDHNLVQRNRVQDTGGHPLFGATFGMSVTADVLDNVVAGVFSPAANAYPTGIVLRAAGTVARGNRVDGLAPTGEGVAVGIRAMAPAITFEQNHVSASVATPGTGLFGYDVILTATFCTGNTVARLGTPLLYCRDSGGNDGY